MYENVGKHVAELAGSSVMQEKSQQPSHGPSAKYPLQPKLGPPAKKSALVESIQEIHSSLQLAVRVTLRH